MLAEDQSLRRLERDIHDGPQQRLVRLQMDLASAERKLDADPDAAKALLAEAREQARDTLEELRALSRGFAPPILQDRGLVAGLESLAARSTIPVQPGAAARPRLRLPPEIERSAYFVAAELLTNAAKHSGATRDPPAPRAAGSTPDGTQLARPLGDRQRRGRRVVARGPRPERASTTGSRGLRGVLSIDSPRGGPTASWARTSRWHAPRRPWSRRCLS